MTTPPTPEQSARIVARVAEAVQIEADSERDRWFTAAEARDYGLVDHVVESATQVPSEGPVS